MPRLEKRGDGVRVHFDAPILDQDVARLHVDLRAPTAGAFLELGDPLTWVVGPDGAGTRIVDRALLGVWASRLTVEGDMVLILRGGDLALGMLIEQAVMDFFTSARIALAAASAPSPSAPTSPASPT